MSLPKKFAPSWNFSVTILAIGMVCLISALLFAHALQNVRLAANLAEHSCSGTLQTCMRSAEKVHGDVKTAKSACQNEYNICTNQGGKMHAW